MRRAYILTRGKAHLWSFDLYIAALCEVLVLFGFDVIVEDHMKIRNLPRHDQNAVWFFVNTHPSLPDVYGTVSPPVGLKIYFNHESLPCESEAFLDTFGTVERQVHVRASDSRFWKRAVTNWKWLKNRIDREWVDAVFDFSPLDVVFLRKDDVNAYWLPTGYHKKFVFESSNRSNDAVTFLGYPMKDDYRMNMLRKIKKRVRVFTPCSRDFNRTIVARYHVSLSLGHSPDYGTFPDLRMAILGSNACTTVMDHCDYSPLKSDEVIECDPEEIPDACVEALSDHSYGKNLHAFMRESYQFENHLKKALEAAEVV